MAEMSARQVAEILPAGLNIMGCFMGILRAQYCGNDWKPVAHILKYYNVRGIGGKTGFQ
jgi:hypothetical protein